jgi:zinc transport system substrate-binding protein
MHSKILMSLTVLGAMFVGVGLLSCGERATVDDNTLVVSIEPLRFIVEAIVGDDFAVTVLVPPGASPETWEPTPQKMRAAENAPLVFSTGLIGFENVILDHLPASERFVDLSAGIEPVGTGAGHACDAGHTHNSSQTHGSVHANDGVDPHIWMAPKALAQMAWTAYGRIHENWPDSTSYTVNYRQLAERLAALDREVSSRLATVSNRSFMIFHPGLTYYARDYELRQIALEIDGKEPSVKQIADLVIIAHTERISKIMYQSEFPRRTVEVVAAEIGATPVEVDILGGDVMDNILYITDIIAGNIITKQQK